LIYNPRVRIAFFALLFANLVYFAWAQWIDAPRPPPTNEAIAHLPQLKLVDELPASKQPQPNTARKTALTQPTACLSVGPFGDIGNSAQAAALLRAKGFDPKQRAEAAPTTVGYWVYVSGLKTQADADKALATLEKSGIKDARVMPETPDAGRRLSLGLYSERGRADRRAKAVRQAGLDAEVAERKLPGTVYWVDLEPPAGMTTIPLADLFAEGVSSRISVQPCPSGAQSPTAPATGTATVAPGSPEAGREAVTARNSPARR
jgi:hypothetical protein